VFCFDCAKNQVEKICPRCKESFSIIEQTALGTVFICTIGGGKQTPRGCKRTYLSQRDLNAHIQHRHNRPATTTPGQPVTLEINPKLVPPNKPSSANLPPSSISQQIASTLPGNIDLSDLSNITDAQLKAAADILAATINASKPAKPAPDAALAMLPQNPYFAPNPAGFPPAQYPPNSNAPMMRIPGAPQHPTPFTNVGTPFQPHPAYQNMPQPATNMVPMNQGGMQSQPGFSQAGPFFPQGRPMSRPPMSGAPNSNFGPGRGPRIGHQALPVSGHGMMQHPPTVNVANAPGRPPPNAMFPAGGPPRGPPPTSSVRPPSVGYY
jgi:E3 ubiquitin-protein ligase Hakai